MIKYTGLIPKVIICDQGTNNVAMRKLFGITLEYRFITFDCEQKYFFYDNAFIKSVRNN